MPSPNSRLQSSADFDPVSHLDLLGADLCPPEPQLLDTCVLQNLDWVDRKIEATPNGESVWTPEAEAQLQERYGADHADDLIDLGILYKEFEYRGGYPWAICTTAIEEAGLLKGPKGDRVRQIIDLFAGHQELWANCTFPSVTAGALLARERGRVSPLILRAIGVKTADEVILEGGPLGFLVDHGDRLVAAHALFANIPVILTTDRQTFWSHRERLAQFGVAILRPVELLQLYDNYWANLDG